MGRGKKKKASRNHRWMTKHTYLTSHAYTVHSTEYIVIDGWGPGQHKIKDCGSAGQGICSVDSVEILLWPAQLDRRRRTGTRRVHKFSDLITTRKD
jgi:hypothetical protein